MIDVDGCHSGFGVTEGFKVSHDVAFPARRVSGWTIMAGWADFEGTFVASGPGWLVWCVRFCCCGCCCFWYIDFGLIPYTDAPVVSCSARSFDVSHVRAVEKGLVDGEGRSDVE